MRKSLINYYNISLKKTLFVAIINFFFSYISLFFFSKLFIIYFDDINYLVVLFITYHVNLLFSFATNKFFNFKTLNKFIQTEFFKLYLAQLILVIFNIFLMRLLLEVWNLNFYFTIFFITTLSAVYTFITNYFVIFLNNTNYTSLYNELKLFAYNLYLKFLNIDLFKVMFKKLRLADNFSSQYYCQIRHKRIKYIIRIFGKNFFKNKTCLELGCGYGYIGKYFQNIGVKVLFAEGRKENFNFLKKKSFVKNSILLDQDNKNKWNLNKKFDFIIHWGISCHLKYWREDLIKTFNHTKLIFFETVVLDSKKSEYVLVNEFNNIDQSLYGSGSRASEKYIENFINNNGWYYIKCMDTFLDGKYFSYSWKNKNSRKWNNKLRRFYLLFKNKTTKNFYEKKIISILKN